jgi:hypothetical protein
MESTNSYKNRIPHVDGQKYVFWSIRMKTYIQAQGFEIWQSIVDGYTIPVIPPTNDKVVKLGQNNSPMLHIVNPPKIFGTSFEILMKKIQNSKQQNLKLTKGSSNN